MTEAAEATKNGSGVIDKSNSEFIAEFLIDSDCRGVTKRTIENYRSCLKIFFNYIEKPALQIDVSDFKKFLVYLKEERQYAVSTINSYFSTLFSFYEFLEFEGYINKNPEPRFRKRYLNFLRNNFHTSNGSSERQLITIEQMRKLINSILDPRDKCVVTLLAKTGIRRNEFINIDVDDINWIEQSIELKNTPKRSNKIVFFDDECARILREWLYVRGRRTIKPGENALFLNERGGRLGRNGVYTLVTKYAERIGIHKPKSKKLNERFTTHCCRHWFTTYLLRGGMPREYVKELRGDSRGDAIDIYHHIDREELRESYLAHIPQLGV